MDDNKKVVRVCEICGKQVKAAKFLFENTTVSGMCTLLNDTGMEHIKIERKQLYESIPIEKKQAFLDHFWKGLTVGESYKAAGLTQEEGFAVLDFNIERMHYLRIEAK